MNMISIATYLNNLAVESITYTAEIAMKLGFHWWMNKWFAMLCAENYVDVVFYERLSHRFFITPFQGLL